MVAGIVAALVTVLAYGVLLWPVGKRRLSVRSRQSTCDGWQWIIIGDRE